MARGLIPFDKRCIGAATSLVGIDEAGRGCLAGPVVAAAVSCSGSFYRSSFCRQAGRGVDDSKRLTPRQRAAVVGRFREARHEKWIQIGIGTASVEEIERFNIYQANVLAMRRAFAAIHGDEGDVLDGFLREPDAAPVILIDGKPIRTFPHPHQGVVKGDCRSFAIALAGIHAKEWRDARMRELDAEFPGYGFSTHKGYGTRQHLEALRDKGPTRHHRKQFLRKFRAVIEAAEPIRQDSLF